MSDDSIQQTITSCLSFLEARGQRVGDFGIQKEKNHVSQRGKNLVFVSSTIILSLFILLLCSFFSKALAPAERNLFVYLFIACSPTTVKAPGGQSFVQFTTVSSVPRVPPGPSKVLDTYLLNE